MAGLKGGDKLKAKLASMVAMANNAKEVRVGFLAEAKYPDGTSVAMVAAIQNFGAPAAGIPPRPFFRNAIAKHKDEWPKAISELLVDNDYDALRTLQQTGEAIAGQIRQSLVDTNEPPLKAATLRARGVASDLVYNPKDSRTFGAKPLIDTGNMLDSISYQVKE